ncbi:TIGR03619 family F420-dependent LLM class oxidoreductase [Gordonia humi]|uniref:TIGR03619 family F420-dependent LLM class oxidoreductase n=1 Tax=Gordonia humi TaxID=686429 RepID=UPI00360DDF29
MVGGACVQPRAVRERAPGGANTAQHHIGPVVHPTTHLLDPTATLAAAAMVTTRIQLGTAVLVLPLRHPLLVGRALATLDELAPGRIVLGVGAGWLREEFTALDVDFADRGRRLRESVSILRSCLGGGFVEHHGTVFDFDALQMVEKPVHVPLIVGGNGPVALRRAATLGDGWFSSGSLDLDESVALRDSLVELLAERGRSEDDFEIVIRPKHADVDVVRAHAEAGLRHVVVWADQVWDAEDPRSVQIEKLREFLAEVED